MAESLDGVLQKARVLSAIRTMFKLQLFMCKVLLLADSCIRRLNYKIEVSGVENRARGFKSSL